MTVKELISQLEEMPLEAEVFVLSGGEDLLLETVVYLDENEIRLVGEE
ncbi:hypothetical protein A0J48_006945 [Sphaerospermopsis aphanizomenoides BCCUSP55]|nr:hypothetical protein [Sphaerospermopsis aphanizomenoides]MBK1987273.1 hypothetical protein [Sphaerospermopsis aphanizomenoides BCCUSP55]